MMYVNGHNNFLALAFKTLITVPNSYFKVCVLKYLKLENITFVIDTLNAFIYLSIFMYFLREALIFDI